jgi:hypothetical protein
MALAMKILFFSLVPFTTDEWNSADSPSYAVAGVKVGPDLGDSPLDS